MPSPPSREQSSGTDMSTHSRCSFPVRGPRQQFIIIIVIIVGIIVGPPICAAGLLRRRADTKNEQHLLGFPVLVPICIFVLILVLVLVLVLIPTRLFVV